MIKGLDLDLLIFPRVTAGVAKRRDDGVLLKNRRSKRLSTNYENSWLKIKKIHCESWGLEVHPPDMEGKTIDPRDFDDLSLPNHLFR